MVLAPEGGIHAIKTVCIDQDPYIRMLVEVRPVDIDRLRLADRNTNRDRLVESLPIYFAWHVETQALMFYPAADKDYTVGVMYYPQVREL